MVIPIVTWLRVEFELHKENRAWRFQINYDIPIVTLFFAA